MFHELTDTESAIVAQHRAGFLAGTQPMPAEACSELGAEPDAEDGPMEMLAYAGVTTIVVIAALVAVFV